MKLFFVSLILFVASVSAQVAAKYGSVTGLWRYTEKDGITELTLSPDGTFSGFVRKESEPEWRFSGDWTLDGKLIRYVYRKSSHVDGPVEHQNTDEILELSSDRLVVKDLDSGRIFRCIRIENENGKGA